MSKSVRCTCIILVQLHFSFRPCTGKMSAHIPLWFDVCASADVVFGGEHKFVVKNPLWLVVQNCRWVQLDHLVVFDCEVMTCTFQMGHLGGFNKKTGECRPILETGKVNLQTPPVDTSFVLSSYKLSIQKCVFTCMKKPVQSARRMLR